MEFDDKARENLEAAHRLLQDDSGNDCLPNAVASRAYYSAYLAVAHVAQQRKIPFTSDKAYYVHDTLPDAAARHGIVDAGGRTGLKWLYSSRIKADYLEDSVEFDEANAACEAAKELVEGLPP